MLGAPLPGRLSLGWAANARVSRAWAVLVWGLSRCEWCLGLNASPPPECPPCGGQSGPAAHVC